MTSGVPRKRIDLGQDAYELRQQGLTYRAIAKWLGVTVAMAGRVWPKHGTANMPDVEPNNRDATFVGTKHPDMRVRSTDLVGNDKVPVDLLNKLQLVQNDGTDADPVFPSL